MAGFDEQSFKMFSEEKLSFTNPYCYDLDIHNLIVRMELNCLLSTRQFVISIN